MYVCVCLSSCLLPLAALAGNSADNQDVRLVRGVADTIGKAVAGGVQVGAGCPFGVVRGYSTPETIQVPGSGNRIITYCAMTPPSFS